LKKFEAVKLMVLNIVHNILNVSIIRKVMHLENYAGSFYLALKPNRPVINH
jgi:hypothetical protein